jgi:hypothetical protein
VAEFCLQCTRELYTRTARHPDPAVRGFAKARFGDLKGDFAGISTEEDTRKGRYAGVLCEGCGAPFGIVVDHEGRCVSTRCDKHGEENKKRREKEQASA